MKRLLLLIIICLCITPVLAQDATADSTAPALPTDTIAVVSGEGDTIVNVGGETPADDVPATPAEPMPWWASLALEITKLVGLYLVVVHGIREAVKAFMANPARVRSAEDAVNLARSLIPDAIEEAAQKAGERAVTETRALIEDLQRAVTALTDGVPESSKQALPKPSTSVTPGGYTQTTPPMP